jgi:hypothetical protein
VHQAVAFDKNKSFGYFKRANFSEGNLRGQRELHTLRTSRTPRASKDAQKHTLGRSESKTMSGKSVNMAKGGFHRGRLE